MIKGLIFDLDGVITETSEWHFLAWKKILKNYDIDYFSNENNQLKGLNRIDTLKAILKLKKINDWSIEKINSVALAKNDYYLQLLNENLSSQNILPGIEQLIIDAKKNNLKLALASSSFNAKLILEKIGLLNNFDFIVDPKTIKKGKPDPEIFLKAAAGINLKPEECLGFEDAIAGIQGLNAAKIKTVAITNGIKNSEWEKAQFVFNTTEAIKLADLVKTK
ncbi:Beta-phosphoglucomutase [[Mycoplasma] cavipharyngis]|uniref:beta-phosphoglucomutase n=1 Tax=[Mycoplasma] cavipharyngis TaxID=92757 RepID=UPI00370404F2